MARWGVLSSRVDEEDSHAKGIVRFIATNLVPRKIIKHEAFEEHFGEVTHEHLEDVQRAIFPLQDLEDSLVFVADDGVAVVDLQDDIQALLGERIAELISQLNRVRVAVEMEDFQSRPPR